MSPAISISNHGYKTVTNSKHSCSRYCPDNAIKCVDLLDLSIGEFTSGVFCPSHDSLGILSGSISGSGGKPPFSSSVLGVVLKGSNKKMFWIAARRIVAFVEHAHSVWYRTKSQHPCRSMRFYISGSVGAFSNLTISPLCPHSNVLQTSRFSLLKSRIQAIWKCNRQSLRSQKLWGNFELFVHTLKGLTDHALGRFNVARAFSL